MTETLHIFAVNQPLAARHTHLTRLQGEVPTLPPLAEWAGMMLDTDRIELFPTTDLEGTSLSSYLATAFAAKVDADQARRLDALHGPVLLVPDRTDQTPAPDSHLTLVASLPMAEPDHRPQPMPPADATGAMARGGPPVPTRPVPVPRWLIALLLGFVIVIGLIVFL